VKGKTGDDAPVHRFFQVSFVVPPGLEHSSLGYPDGGVLDLGQDAGRVDSQIPRSQAVDRIALNSEARRPTDDRPSVGRRSG